MDWRVWAEGREVYVGARNTAHEYKASFHSSGQCHVGLSQNIRKSLVGDPTWEGKSRLFSKWILDPNGCKVHSQILIALIFPDSYLDTESAELNSGVLAIQSQAAKITAVTIIRTCFPKGTFLTSTDPSFLELHRLILPDGLTIFTVQRQFPETPEYHDYIKERFSSHINAIPTPNGRTYGAKPMVPWGPNIRALLWDGSQPVKRWHEVSARKVNNLWCWFFFKD